MMREIIVTGRVRSKSIVENVKTECRNDETTWPNDVTVSENISTLHRFDVLSETYFFNVLYPFITVFEIRYLASGQINRYSCI